MTARDRHRADDVGAPERLLNQLRAAISDGQLGSGERLPSARALAELFGVSPASVRAAVRSLVSAGLVSAADGAKSDSWFVSETGSRALADAIVMSLQAAVDEGNGRAHEVATVLEQLEVLATRQAALLRTPSDLLVLADVLDAAWPVGATGPGAGSLDVDFHHFVVAASHNDVLAELVLALRRVTTLTCRRGYPARRSRGVLREHRAIFDAVASGDADLAEAAMRVHLVASGLGAGRTAEPRRVPPS